MLLSDIATSLGLVGFFCIWQASLLQMGDVIEEWRSAERLVISYKPDHAHWDSMKEAGYEVRLEMRIDQS